MPVMTDEDGKVLPRNEPRAEGTGDGWVLCGGEWHWRDKAGTLWTGRSLFWLNMFLGALWAGIIAAGLYYM